MANYLIQLQIDNGGPVLFRTVTRKHENMTVLEKLIGFLKKEHFDFDNPHISLRDFHPQIYVVYMLNGIFFNNANSKFRFFLPVLNAALALTATGFELVHIYHGFSVKDYAFASESFCYLVILGSIPFIIISTLYNSDVIKNQLDEMDKDFIYISKLMTRHKDHFMKGQLVIWQLCWVCFGFFTFIVTVYIGNTLVILLYQSLLATQTEYSQRQTIFPIWLPYDDPYRTPNYEVFLVLQIEFILSIYQIFCGYVYLQFHILLHYYFMMDMIIFDFEDIFLELDESVAELPIDDPRRVEVKLILNSRMKRIVQWHVSVLGSVDALSSVYGPPLAYQVTFSSVAICIMAFQIVNQLENGKIDFLFAILLSAAFIQLWIPCYLGTFMRNKAFSLGDACWYCGWSNTKLSIMLRNEMVIFILMAQQPVIIKYNVLPALTLETFSSIMSSSYSYFNMLRQSAKD